MPKSPPSLVLDGRLPAARVGAVVVALIDVLRLLNIWLTPDSAAGEAWPGSMVDAFRLPSKPLGVY